LATQGDPSAVPYAVENVRAVLGQKPVFGICMGHQLLGQAFGGETFKLKFGHHGGNHPIRFEPTSASPPAVHHALCFLYG
jgi:carbamoyl-phosphate synthase small subunit